jgi:hypothetical protein
MRARRLPFLTTAGPARRFEGNVLALPPTADVEPACTDFPICSGGPDSSESALQVDLVAAPAAGAVASREQTAEQPGKPSAGEVHHALKAALLEVGDRAGAKIADTLIRILRQRPLDLKLLPGDVDSIAQIRQRDKDDADIWLRGMQFVERTIANPEDPRATGVSWLRCLLECLTRQFVKAKEGDVYYDPFIEVDRAGQRVYNHPLGCKLANEAIVRTKDAVMRSQSGAWHTNYSFVGALQVYSDKSCQTLKAGAQTLLPLHVTALNLSQGRRQQLIANGDTIIAFLPVGLLRSEVKPDTGNGEYALQVDDHACGSGVDDGVGGYDRDEDADGGRGDEGDGAGGSFTGRATLSAKLRRNSKLRLIQESIRVAFENLLAVATKALWSLTQLEDLGAAIRPYSRTSPI